MISGELKAATSSRALIAALAAMVAISLLTDELCAQGRSLSVHLDNDLFADTDDDYTNGVRVSYIVGDRAASGFNKIESWLESVHSKVPDLVTGLKSIENPSYDYGISITQLMFTPTDFTAPEPPEGEHPYVGWLGMGFSLHAKDDNAINSIELSLGLTGRKALAENTQDFVHDLRSIETFEGWDSQMPTEATLNLFLTQKRRFFRDEPCASLLCLDGFGEWALALGNFEASASIGFVSRFGLNLPADFSDPRLGPTVYAHDLFDGSQAKRDRWSAYGIFGARGTGYLHAISRDGPLLRDFDTGISSQAFVGETYLGLAIRIRGVELSYAHTFRSKEFAEQANGTQFGSLACRVKF